MAATPALKPVHVVEEVQRVDDYYEPEGRQNDGDRWAGKLGHTHAADGGHEESDGEHHGEFAQRRQGPAVVPEAEKVQDDAAREDDE